MARLLSEVPLDDWAGISAVVFRQPTRKQDLLRPMWGRLVFDTQESGITGSAIQLDAQDPRQEIRWNPSLRPDHQKELSALVADGHRVVRRSVTTSTGAGRRGNSTSGVPLAERERSAHRYAMTLRMELDRRGAVPFDRIRDEAAMRADGLDPRCFGST